MSFDIQDFQRDVIEASRDIPVLVDFWAEWCGPCRVLGPVLEELAEASAGRWRLAKVNTELHQQEAAAFGIRSIPNVKLFVDGEPVDEFVGALPKQAIEQWLDKALPSPNSAVVAEAKQALEAGKRDAALAMVEGVLESEPSNSDARLLLARERLFDDPDDAVALLEPMQDEVSHAQEMAALQDIARLIHIADSADELPDSPVRDAYLAAAGNLSAGDFDAALDGFIEILAADRSFDEDGARRACIAIFTYLGEDHPLTLEHRRRFSRNLHA